MNRSAMLILVLLILTALPQAVGAQVVPVTGEWDLTINAPQGQRSAKVTFKEEGGKLTGNFQAGARSFPLDGTLTGKDIKFTFTASFQGDAIVVTMTGDVEGDSMKGTANFGSLGTGDWTGKRAVAAASSPSAPATSASAGVGELTGDWDVTINSPVGTNNAQVTFTQEGEKLVGVMKGARGQLPVEVSVKGKEVKIVYTIQFEGNPMIITMTGQREGDSIKGAADFGGLAAGDWSANRKGSAASSAGGTASAGQVDVSGAWLFQVETAAGSGSPTFTFTQQGEKLTGQYKGIFGEAPLTGTVKGNKITFSFKVSVEGTEANVTYTGTIDKDSMQGTATVAEFGSATWTAKRQ